jgi:hypothetical protein
MNPNIDAMGRDRPEEITSEMIEAGAKALDEELWKLDPFARAFSVEMLKLVVPKVYRAMTCAAARK